MKKFELNKIAQELIEKDKWSEHLRRFTEVLRINIFIVDDEGRVILPPARDAERAKYGADFLTYSFGFDFSGQNNLLKAFHQNGPYWEVKDPFDFYAFAIPIILEEDKTVAYLIVGPVILNRGWDSAGYINLASQLKLNIPNLVDVVHEIRIVSFVAMKGILDLLSEVSKDIIELSYENQRLSRWQANKEILPEDLAQVAQDLYATIHLDELLVTVLDVALNLAQAEAGSIMILDEKDGELTIKVSRGIGDQMAKKAKQKLGEGISGIAAQENESFLISGTEADDRIRHLLKRSDIKQSMIMPLAVNNRVFGVLNIHTKNENAQIEANLPSIRHLSRLISTAISSI